MAINEELTGDAVSATGLPAGEVSDVVIGSAPEGKIWLQVQPPGSSNWYNVTDMPGAWSCATPDTALTYRFKSVGLSEATEVYFS